MWHIENVPQRTVPLGEEKKNGPIEGTILLLYQIFAMSS